MTIIIRFGITLSLIVLLNQFTSAQVSHDICNVFGCIGGDSENIGAEGACYLDFYKYRTYDGSQNNLYHFDYGKAGIPFSRLSTAQYNGDGSTLIDRVNPRRVSNTLCSQDESIPSESELSIFMFSWLQFLDHDITITEEASEESIDISVPLGDPFFDPFFTGTQTIPLTRVFAKYNSGTSASNPREQINNVSVWVDASNVYGSDGVRADWLRSMKNGKLKTSPSPNGDILPCNTINGNCNEAIDMEAPFMQGQENRCGERVKLFVAGDVRANEQPGLLALHTLFVKEHNRICDELIAKGSYNDEYNYQYARKVVGGLMQSITYNEVLPALGLKLDHYTGYKAYTCPNILNEFATAGYRLGHTMVNSQIPYLTETCENAQLVSGCGEGTAGVFDGTNCFETCGQQIYSEPLQLLNGFFDASLLANNGLDVILNGMASQVQEEVDLKIVGDIRNFLFGPPGAGGLDLASINIQRGRDHGLPDYNTIRSALHLQRFTDFRQISSNGQVAEKLESLYGSIDNIDAWVGLLAEDHLTGSSLGETLHELLKLQFENLRDADRFWFKRDHRLSYSTRLKINNTRLADIINRNTSITKLSNVFYANECSVASNEYCTATGSDTNFEWIQSVKFGEDKFYSGNDGGYGDYTDKRINMTAGNAIYFRLKPGYSNYRYYQKWIIWIDLNHDGSFSYDERVYARIGRTKSGYLKVPGNALPGITRMRIAMSGTETPSACGDFEYGEVEDYSVSISPFDGVFRLSNTVVEEDNFDEPVFLASEYEAALYPNPIFANETIYLHYMVKTASVGSYPLQIFNALGQLVYEQDVQNRVGDNTVEIKLSNFNAGHYTVRYTNGFRMLGKSFEVLAR